MCDGARNDVRSSLQVRDALQMHLSPSLPNAKPLLGAKSFLTLETAGVGFLAVETDSAGCYISPTCGLIDVRIAASESV